MNTTDITSIIISSQTGKNVKHKKYKLLNKTISTVVFSALFFIGKSKDDFDEFEAFVFLQIVRKCSLNENNVMIDIT